MSTEMGRRCAESLRVASLTTLEVAPRLADPGCPGRRGRGASTEMGRRCSQSLRVASLTTFEVAPLLSRAGPGRPGRRGRGASTEMVRRCAESLRVASLTTFEVAPLLSRAGLLLVVLRMTIGAICRNGRACDWEAGGRLLRLAQFVAALPVAFLFCRSAVVHRLCEQVLFPARSH